MSAFFILCNVILLLAIPAGIILLYVLAVNYLARDARQGKPERPRTVLSQGSQGVLAALDAGDVQATRRAFLEMTTACGSCDRPYRKPNASATLPQA